MFGICRKTKGDVGVILGVQAGVICEGEEVTSREGNLEVTEDAHLLHQALRQGIAYLEVFEPHK